MRPSTTLSTMQPVCVHTAVRPTNRPAVGWVTTTSRLSNTVPPPTGTSDAGPSLVPAEPEAVGWATCESAGASVGGPGGGGGEPAHPATAPPAASPAAAAITCRLPTVCRRSAPMARSMPVYP